MDRLEVKLPDGGKLLVFVTGVSPSFVSFQYTLLATDGKVIKVAEATEMLPEALHVELKKVLAGGEVKVRK